jgi:soluble lytic murein transglycosylase
LKSILSLAVLVLLFVSMSTSAVPAATGGDVVSAPEPVALSASDQALREGWKLLAAEKYPLARDKFRKIPPSGYDLADYVLAFTGMSYAREGNLTEAAATWDNLVAGTPGSPLVPLLAIELSFLAARQDNLALAGRWYEAGKGHANGTARRAEAGYVAARLQEAADPARAAGLHLQNFSSYSAQEGGTLSGERLAAWWHAGRLTDWNLPIGFYARYAKAVFRAGDAVLARQLYRDALRRYPISEEYLSLMYDFAELLRKLGDTRASRALLGQAVSASPAGVCSEASFLLARVRWRSGDLVEARAAFDNIASSGLCSPAVSARALHLSAWISEEAGDLPRLTETFGRLRTAADETIRQESVFRYAFGLFRLGQFDNAASAFADGARSGRTSVERSRHRYWQARSLEQLGRTAESGALFQRVASDPNAGIYALFALARRGSDPYAMLNSPSSLETRGRGVDRAQLWDTVRRADWGKEDAEKLKRSERLSRMGLLEYAVFEADRVDRTRVRKAVGIAESGTAGFFRYLAGDIRGALQEADRLPTDPDEVGLLEKIQFPLAPEMVGDPDRKQSGLDPLVLHSIIRQESQFSPTILSPAGAVGLMQLMPRTAAETARRIGRPRPKRRELVNPVVNVELGAAYLARLVRTFDGDYARAVAAYNAGETAVSRWWARSGGDPAAFLENISFRETRGYVRRVFFNLLQYYRIYRPQMLARYLATAPTEAATAPGAPGIPPTGASGAAGPEATPPGPADEPGGTTPISVP